MIYVNLFLSFFQIGVFSFGGGYAAMSLMQNQVVDIHSWLSMKEFADAITISQMTPGSINISLATFVGMRIAGLPGAIVATFGCILPSCAIVLFLAYLYYKYRELCAVKGILIGLRSAVTALIGSVGLTLVVLSFWNGKDISWNFESIDFFAVIIFTISIAILRKWKVNPIFVIIGTGIIGLCVYPLLIK